MTLTSFFGYKSFYPTIREITLNFHPHLHIVVTGGLSADADTWIAAGNSFLLPVKALSKIIRAKFLEALDQSFQDGRVQGNVSCLADPVSRGC